MTDTVEKVARAVLAKATKLGIELENPLAANPAMWTPERVANEIAHAAIAAHIECLMEPTEEIWMIGERAFNAAKQEWLGNEKPATVARWQAMLQASKEAGE